MNLLELEQRLDATGARVARKVMQHYVDTGRVPTRYVLAGKLLCIYGMRICDALMHGCYTLADMREYERGQRMLFSGLN